MALHFEPDPNPVVYFACPCCTVCARPVWVVCISQVRGWPRAVVSLAASMPYTMSAVAHLAVHVVQVYVHCMACKCMSYSRAPFQLSSCQAYRFLPACSSSTVQLMRAADYYFQHLDRKVQVVVVSDAGLSGNPLSPAAPQQQATDTAETLAAINTSDDELDQLLQGGGPEDFDLGALQPLQSCDPQQTPQPHQVWFLVCFVFAGHTYTLMTSTSCTGCIARCQSRSSVP